MKRLLKPVLGVKGCVLAFLAGADLSSKVHLDRTLASLGGDWIGNDFNRFNRRIQIERLAFSRRRAFGYGDGQTANLQGKIYFCLKQLWRCPKSDALVIASH
jgi:hypothetical protein